MSNQFNLTFYKAIECVLKDECWIQGADFADGVVLMLKDDKVVTHDFNHSGYLWETTISIGVAKQMFRKVYTQPEAMNR